MPGSNPSYGFRPRSDAERMRLAHMLRTAPAPVGAVVGLGFDDDGWTAACLAVAGHAPVWASTGDPRPCDAVLARLGLAPLGTQAPNAVLNADLSWRDGAPTAGTSAIAGRAASLPANAPLVTVLVCTYNRAKLLPLALASALAQTWPCEVLVVDDGSTDTTPEVLAAAQAGGGVRALRQEPNQGKPAALARGVAEARGEAILVLDDDDLLMPGAVQVLATALFDGGADDTRVAAWADTITFDDATGAPTSVIPAVRVPSALVPRAVLQQIPAMPGATLVRRSAWLAAGPLDPTLIRGQDMDLFLALSRLGPIVTVPIPTFWYRSHDALRGSAAGQWNKRDASKHRARFLSFVQPVFRRRWQTLAGAADRAEGHAWALGLWQRDLPAEARAELRRWPGPWTPAEAWVRSEIGIQTEGRVGSSTLIVADDGDEGALEQTLYAHHRGDALFVNIEVPRDPLGNVRLYWPGTYGAREILSRWVTRPGPWRLALTSAPEWAPPPLDDPGLLPDVRGPDALIAVAAVCGWPRPVRTRPGLGRAEGPLAARAWMARDALTAKNPMAAMGALAPVLEQLPSWRGGWSLAAEAFAALGESAQAAACAARAAPSPTPSTTPSPTPKPRR